MGEITLGCISMVLSLIWVDPEQEIVKKKGESLWKSKEDSH
jgi:hypothetical protein